MYHPSRPCMYTKHKMVNGETTSYMLYSYRETTNTWIHDLNLTSLIHETVYSLIFEIFIKLCPTSACIKPWSTPYLTQNLTEIEPVSMTCALACIIAACLNIYINHILTKLSYGKKTTLKVFLTSSNADLNPTMAVLLLLTVDHQLQILLTS